MVNKFYQAVILVLVGMILFLQFCGKKKAVPCPQIIKTDTVIIRDTVWVKKVDSSKHSYVPKIRSTAIHIGKFDLKSLPDGIQGQGDSFILSGFEPVRKQAKDSFYFKNTYSDTLQTGYGPVIVKDTVQYNRIIGRAWTSELSLPVITETKTVTNTVEAPAKTKVYGGFEVLGNRGQFVQAIAGDIMVITKQERVINGGPVYFPGHGWGGKIGTKFLLFKIK